MMDFDSKQGEPVSGGWQGSRSIGEVPRITINLYGFSLSPETLRARAAGYRGLGIHQYVERRAGEFEIHLQQNDGDGARRVFACEFRHSTDPDSTLPPADFAVCVGQGTRIGARRYFCVPDEDTAAAFLLAVISQLQGEGGMCVDLADLLHAWEPFVQHEVRWLPLSADQSAHRIPVGGEGGAAALFVLAGAGAFDLALVERLCSEVSRNPANLGAMVVGHVLLDEKSPTRTLAVWRHLSGSRP